MRQPIDFLERLERVERKEESSTTTGEQQQENGPMGQKAFMGAWSSKRPDHFFKPDLKNPHASNRGNGNAASADQVLAQLRSMQSEIDEIRQKKRALTPPEKVAGSLNL
jgi:hypothetical protein